MKLLEERIRKDGIIGEGDVLKVGAFLNQQMDIRLLCACAKEFDRLFRDSGVTKILTIEASGIGIACLVAECLDVPVVFAKKSRTSNVSGDVYTTVVHSYTHGNDNQILLPKAYLPAGEKVLLIDDFLASGCALIGLRELCSKADAEIVGAGVLVEKVYQSGGNLLRAEGMRIESLARIASMSVEDGIRFVGE